MSVFLPTRPLRRLAASGLVLACAGLATLAVSTLAYPAPAPLWQQQTSVDPDALFVGSTKASPVEGRRDVWAFAVHSPDVPPVSTSVLGERLPRQLGWFAEVSGGRFSFELARVLEPLVVYSSDCATQRSAFDEHVDALSPPEDVHVLGFLSASCTWAGLGTLGSNRVLISGASATSLWRMGVVIHELGHNLGLSHGLKSTCPALRLASFSEFDPVLWSPAAACELDEYGDISTPMGRSGPRRPLAYSPMELEQLGWGEGLREVHAGFVRVIPAAASGPDAVLFSSADGHRYALSLRQLVPGVVSDASLGKESLLVMHWYDRASGSWVLVPFRSHEPGARVGDSWVTPDGSVALRIVALGSYALVEIDRPASGRWEDSWPAWVESWFEVTDIAAHGAGGVPRLVTLTWDTVDSSPIRKVVVTTPSRRWVFPPGRGMLPFIVSRGESLSVAIKVIDAAGNTTLHRTSWSAPPA